MAGMSKMNSYFSKQQKKQKLQTDNPIEVIKDFGLGVVKSAKNDLLGGIANNATEQILGFPSQKREGVLSPNEDINLSNLANNEKQENVMWFGEKSAFKPLEQSSFTNSEMEIQQKIQEILRELKLLAKSIEKVNKEAAKITVEQIPQDSGVYHLNFFEWVLRMIKTAKAKVSESALWLETFNCRKKQKGYWAMFKKHGTTFGLSSERSLATQTG